MVEGAALEKRCGLKIHREFESLPLRHIKRCPFGHLFMCCHKCYHDGMTAYGNYPAAFYRVSLKAVIRSDAGEVLCVTESERDMWELPGGGLDHGETIQQGLSRELKEEIGYTGEFTFTYADTTILYDDVSGYCRFNQIYDVVLAEPDGISPGTDVMQMMYKDPYIFKDVPYRGGQLIYKSAVDHQFVIAFDRTV